MVVRAATVLLAVLLLGAFAAKAQLLSTPQGKILRELDHQLNELPGFAERAKGMTRTERELFVGQLTLDGLRRLDDESVERYMTSLERLLVAADTATCGAFAGGRMAAASGRELSRILELMEPAEVQSFSDVTLASVSAVLRRQPVLEVDVHAARLGMAAAFRQMGEGDSARLADGLGNTGSLRTAELCWVGRRLYGATNALGEPSRAALSRLFIQTDDDRTRMLAQP